MGSVEGKTTLATAAVDRDGDAVRNDCLGTMVGRMAQPPGSHGRAMPVGLCLQSAVPVKQRLPEWAFGGW